MFLKRIAQTYDKHPLTYPRSIPKGTQPHRCQFLQSTHMRSKKSLSTVRQRIASSNTVSICSEPFTESTTLRA